MGTLKARGCLGGTQKRGPTRRLGTLRHVEFSTAAASSTAMMAESSVGHTDAIELISPSRKTTRRRVDLFSVAMDELRYMPSNGSTHPHSFTIAANRVPSVSSAEEAGEDTFWKGQSFRTKAADEFFTSLGRSGKKPRTSPGRGR